MGTGELSMFMKTWAEKVCREHGLHDKVVAALERKLKQQRKNLNNLLGKDIMDELDKHIDEGLQKWQGMWKQG